MFKIHNILGFCLTLALLMAGFSDAHAAPIVIDPFDGPDQQAPPDNRLDLPSVLGGSRLLQSTGEATIIVASGVLQALNAEGLGGNVAAIWDGGGGPGGLGGVDLTDGGSNEFFEVVVVPPSSIVAPTETLGVIVEDSSGIVGRFDIGWTELVFGSNLIPFSSLTNGVDLTSVDLVRLENVIVAADRAIVIDSFSVVPIPEPTTGLIGLVSCCFLLASRRRR